MLRLNPVALNTLFLCTGNSARSILAEALANDAEVGRGRLRGYSAGSRPAGRVHPVALETLANHGIDAPAASSKSWTAFEGEGAPRIDVMITVCDSAAAEACPVWPGRPATGHWGVPDPAAETDPERCRQAFEHAFTVLRRRIQAFAELPLDTMDDKQRREAAARIGESS